MTEIAKPIEYEETVTQVSRATIQDEIESHPDFQDLTATQQERVRQWGLVLVDAGFQTGIGLNRSVTNHRSALLADTGAFLEQTEMITKANTEAIK